MADANRVKQLLTEIEAILAYKSKQLITRPDWGAMTFKNAEQDITRIFSVLDLLHVLPLDYLTDGVAERMRTAIQRLKPIFERIDKFTIEQNNATEVRNSTITELRQQTDPMMETVTPWIPFLAYQKGDISQNIEKLTSSVLEAQKVVDAAKSGMEKKAKELDQIIVKAREASAGAGAAVFTHDFQNESVSLDQKARHWLIGTGVFAFLTITIALLTWFWTIAGLDTGQIVQKVASKLIALSVLLTATIWCGRVYKALRHQSTINRHRALALQTFQAFSAATEDPSVKNAVLLETTRSIFALHSTGFIDPGNAEAESQVIEVAKTFAEQK
jgi:hypothetical protein